MPAGPHTGSAALPQPRERLRSTALAHQVRCGLTRVLVHCLPRNVSRHVRRAVRPTSRSQSERAGKPRQMCGAIGAALPSAILPPGMWTPLRCTYDVAVLGRCSSRMAASCLPVCRSVE